MSVRKFITSLILALAVLAGQVGVVLAAPGAQSLSPITGKVQSIVLETNTTTNTTTVRVVLDVNGTPQSISLSLTTATTLNLITIDANNIPSVNNAALGSSVTIDPATILPEPPPIEEKQHPVGAALSDFFSSLTGVNYDTIMNFHHDGIGFGVIAQALWMTSKLGGDTSLFMKILEAKKTGDYSQITLPDGTIPQNWGQLKKALLKGNKDNSVGDAKSNGKDKPDNNGNGHSNNNGNGKDNNPGKGHGK